MAINAAHGSHAHEFRARRGPCMIFVACLELCAVTASLWQRAFVICGDQRTLSITWYEAKLAVVGLCCMWRMQGTQTK